MALYLRNLNTACKHLRAVRRTPLARAAGPYGRVRPPAPPITAETLNGRRPARWAADGLPAAPSCMDAGAIGEGPQL